MMPGSGLLLYGRILASMRVTSVPVNSGVATFAAAPVMATNRQFGALFDLATIDPQAVCYRWYIATSLGRSVIRRPWPGILTRNVEYRDLDPAGACCNRSR